MIGNNILLNKLLDDFYTGIKNRTTFFLQFYASEKILELHLKTWMKDFEYLDQSYNNHDGLETWMKYEQAHNTANKTLNYIHTRILVEGNSYIQQFYSKLTEHAEKYKDIKYESKKHTRFYVKDLILNFSKVFFENIAKSPDSFDMWEYFFPLSWKIPSDISEKSPIVQLTLLQEFITWAKDRIYNNKDSYDEALDDVSKNIFPDVDPVKWAHILIFSLTSSRHENRVSEVISKPWIFGYTGRIRSYIGNNSNAEEEFESLSRNLDESETKNTYKLTFSIEFLQKLFTEKNLNDFIYQAESLHYNKDSQEYRKKQHLLHIFTGLKTFLMEHQNDIS